MDKYGEGMDRLFRETDFAAENPGLKERLWQRLQENIDEDRELSDEELTRLAAAGNIFPMKKP